MGLEKVRTENDITIVALRGQMPHGPELTDVQGKMQKLAREGCGKLVLDLRQLDRFDSACLGLLISCQTHFSLRKGQMRLVMGPGTARRILQVVHLDQILRVDESVEAAIAALS